MIEHLNNLAERDIEKLIPRYLLKVKKTNHCWNWIGAKFQKGYGQFWIPEYKRKIKAHRFSWIIHKGKIPNDLYVLHHCDNRLCINPDHLFLGTHADNVSDKMKKGRMNGGPVCCPL